MAERTARESRRNTQRKDCRLDSFREDLWATAKWFGSSALVLCVATVLRARRAGDALLPGDGWSWASVALPPFALGVVTLIGLSLLRRNIHRLWGSALAGWLFATFVMYVVMALLSPELFAQRSIAVLGFSLAVGAVFGPLFAFCVWLGFFAE